MAKSLTNIIEETLDSALSRTALFQVAQQELAPLVALFVTDNAETGNFTGGPKQHEGYSTNPIKAWKLGSLYKQDNQWGIDPVNVGRVLPSQDELIWRHSGGKPHPFLLGGYKRFRELGGHRTSWVNLTLSGQMLNSVNSTPSIQTHGVAIEVEAKGNEEKAYWTDLQRNWMDLHPKQQAKALKIMVNYAERQINALPPAIFNP